MRGRIPLNLHYAWIVAGVVFITLFGAAGFRSTPGVLIVPFQDEFGWSRATISLAISVNLLLFGLMAPFAAALITISIGVVLTTQMTQSWHMVLLWGVVVGIGTGMMTQVLAATVVNRWFVERRGMMLGVLTAASATGQLLFLPLLAWIVDAYSWRVVTIVVAGAAPAVIPVILIFLKEQPSDLGLEPYGAKPGEHYQPPRIQYALPSACFARRPPQSISGCWREHSSFAARRRMA